MEYLSEYVWECSLEYSSAFELVYQLELSLECLLR